MHDILPKSAPAPPISPALLGELSRLLLSLFAVQNFVPERNGLVGNSRIRVLSVAEFLSPDELTGLRKTSTESLVPKKTVNTIALRSLTDAQISPLMSKAMPSTPSSLGSARKRFSRQRVFELNVASQPSLLTRFVERDQPQRSSCCVRHQQIALGIEGKSISDGILRVIGSFRGLRRLYG